MNKRASIFAILSCMLVLLVVSCRGSAPTTEKSAQSAPAAATCAGHYPSYFQDAAFSSTGMWHDEVIINRPPSDWPGPVFRLSDAYGTATPESLDRYPWLAFDPFDPKLSQDQKRRQAEGYIWAVMRYIQEGNIGGADVSKDWTLCDNKVRPWFHIPYQTYDPMSGREFVHGLTREAPVQMTVDGTRNVSTTIWAVGFYNPAAAQSISEVWTGAPNPKMPTQFAFNDGAVIGKLLFTTATPGDLPYLANVPSWRANISAPAFCGCKPKSGKSCTYKEETEQCPRSVADVYLLQFDIAVHDKRSPIGWTYGTFVADGQRKAGESNPWNRISPLGLMWGNDTPPAGTGAASFPADPRKNGFADDVVFWDAADMLNAHTSGGHLGCDDRLNGPADNPASSCLSCHQTASVPDGGNKSPAIFILPRDASKPRQCAAKPGADSLAVDQVYFKTFFCASSFDGPQSIVPPPVYRSGAKQWISTDFSLQLSISLVEWQEWQQDHAPAAAASANQTPETFDGVLPAR